MCGCTCVCVCVCVCVKMEAMEPCTLCVVVRITQDDDVQCTCAGMHSNQSYCDVITSGLAITRKMSMYM